MKFRLRTIYLMVVLLLGVFVQQSYGYIPSRQAKFITFSNVNATEMSINWVRGNGQGSIVLVRANSAPDVTNIGEDETTGTPSTTFSGSSNFNGTSSHLAFANTTGSSVTVTGLSPNTTYHVMVLEYNVDGSNWDLNNGLGTLNPRSKTTLQGTLGLPSGMSTIAFTGTTATISWTTDGTLATGYYIDVRLNNGAILEAYDLLDIGLPTTKRFYISGLSASTTYQWRLRPYDQYGRVGAATAWQTFATLQVDPTVTISGSLASCGGAGYLVATWPLGTSGGSSYYPSPATGTWTTLAGPAGAGAPIITPNSAAGTSTGSIVVNKAGVYSFQFEIGVGEYYSSTWATYTFNAPTTDIQTTTQSTCGTFLALSATTTGCNTEVGTWSYYGPNGGTGSFENATSENTNFQLTGATPTYGNYTFRWTSTDVGLTSYDEIVVAFAQPATASVTTASVGTCGLTYTLDGNTPISSATGSWSLLGGPLGGTAQFSPNATTPNALVTVNNAGYYSFAWTVSNACATVGTTKHVTFYAPPSTANAGTDAQNCGLTYTLAGNNPTAGTGVWTGPAGVVFGNSATYNSTVTVPSFSGSSTYHSFTWTIDNSICDAKWDDVTVTFYNSPVASVTTTSGANCGLSIANLDGNNPTIGTGSWSVWSNPPTGQPNSPIALVNQGTVSFGDPTSYNSSVTVSQQGAYSFVWTVSNGNCTPATAGKQVTFYVQPNTANAGTDAQNCGLTYTLSGNQATSGTIGTWSQVDGPGSAVITTPTLYNSSVTTPTFAGSNATYTFRWSIGNGNCTTSTDDVVVTFYNAPVASVTTPSISNCGLSIFNLDGNNPTIGTGSWTKVSGPGTVQFGSAAAYNTSVTVSQEGAYSFVWTVTNGNCTPAQAGKQVSFYAEPDLANAGTDAALCSLQYTLAGNIPTAGTGTWTGPVGVSFSPSATAYNAVVTAPSYNNYTLTWTIGNGTCTSNSDQVTVSFRQSPDAYAGVDHNACTGVSNYYTMTATYGTLETGTWTSSPNNPGVATFGNINLPTSTVAFSTPGTYNFTWTTSNGSCSDNDGVTLTVYDPIVIPGDAAISGDNTPAGGTNNIQYSIPNYDDDLTYSWYYTKTESSCSVALPTINNNGSNVVYLDYAMNACDGTLSVNLTDKCNKVSTVHLPIQVLNIPVITGSQLANTNASITITTNTPVFTNCSTGVITPADFQIFFNQNGGTATGVTITSITGTNPYTFNLSVSGTPNGCETIEIKPLNSAVYSGGCVAMLNDQTTGVINLFNKVEPAVATAITSTPYARRAQLNWSVSTPGTKSLVVVNTTNTFNDPSNYTLYPANASYGTQTYNPGQGYTVYNGTGNSVEVLGLNPETNYYVAIWTYTEACGTANDLFNMTQTTASFGTAKQATKLVVTSSPAKITSGTAFNITVQAQAADNSPAYPGCNETLIVTGSASLGTATLNYNQTSVAINNIVYTEAAGNCSKLFTVSDDATCTYSLTSGTFTAAVAPTEPNTQARAINITNQTKTSFKVKWTKGSGTGRILAAKLGNGEMAPFNTLADGDPSSLYSTIPTTSSSSFTGGVDLGSGIKGLYRTESADDNDNQVTITNLESNKVYSVRVFEFNKPSCANSWGLVNFLNSSVLSTNPRNASTLAKIGSFNGIEIAYFDGKSYQLQVDLNWEAITEEGVAHYEIYRQDLNSDELLKVASTNVNVSAGANSKYNVIDNKGLVLGQTYLYRLVAVDFSGQSFDLGETYVTINDEMNSYVGLTLGSINPNPVKDVVKFDVSTTQLSPVYIEIRNLEGQTIYSQEIMVNGTSTIEYKMNAKANGTYYIVATSGDEAVVTTFIYQP